MSKTPKADEEMIIKENEAEAVENTDAAENTEAAENTDSKKKKSSPKRKTKAKKTTYIKGAHGSGSAKMKAEDRRKRANRNKG